MGEPSEGVKDLLVAAGVGTFNAASGWTIHISKLPDAPDTAIAVYDYAGEQSNPRYLLDFPRVQVRVRGSQNGYEDLTVKCQEVKDTLLGIPSQDLNGDRWVGLWEVSSKAFMGYDKKDRPEFSLNYSLIIEPATGTHRESL